MRVEARKNTTRTGASILKLFMNTTGAQMSLVSGSKYLTPTAAGSSSIWQCVSYPLALGPVG